MVGQRENATSGKDDRHRSPDFSAAALKVWTKDFTAHHAAAAGFEAISLRAVGSG